MEKDFNLAEFLAPGNLVNILKPLEVVKPYNCPSCGAEMTKVKKCDAHLWSCPECPIMVFELVTLEDASNLSAYLLTN